jgi:hypothetical protein
VASQNPRNYCLARNWSFSIATMRDSGELQYFHPHVAWAWKRDGETKEKNNFRTLLGGDVIALPRYGRQGDAVDKLLRFLISKDAQKILVEGPSEKKDGVTWPAMRFDVGGITGSEDKKLQDQNESQKDGLTGKQEGLTWPPMRFDVGGITGSKDEKCHKDSPPTGAEAAECARLHLYLARDVVREAMLYAAPTPRFWSPEMHESFTSAFHALVSTKEKEEEEVTAKLKDAAGLYCLEPESEPSKDKLKKQDNEKLTDFIALHFEGFPNARWNDVLDQPRIQVKLVKPKDPPKAASYHTDLCVQLVVYRTDSDG